MKILLASAATAALLIATPAFAAAGPTVQANANASATVVAPLAIFNTTGIAFGSIAADATGGTISVDAAGALTSSVPNLSITGSVGSPANFNLTGGASLAYTAIVPASVSLASGANSMSASLSKSGGAAALSLAGADAFKVIGVLTVGPAQAAGVYSGTFAVTASYD